jgi:hypothetical protein
MLGVSAVASPVRTSLQVGPCTAWVRVVLMHILRRCGVGGILLLWMSRVGRTRCCDGGIYRKVGVRFGSLRVLVAWWSIWDGDGTGRRTCWCLRHTSSSAAAVAAGWIIRTRNVLLGEVARARRLRDGTVLRRRSGRGRVVVGVLLRFLLGGIGLLGRRRRRCSGGGSSSSSLLRWICG